MNTKETIKHIFIVIISNLLLFGSSILIAFFIPNILGVTNYGYYKIYALYLPFIGIFHFGFVDGIYLKYSGLSYESLEKKKFRSFFKFLLMIELFISIVGFMFSFLFIEGQKKFIFCMLFLNLIAVNLITYFKFISIITSRFKEYSLTSIIPAFLNIFIVLVFYFSKIEDYKIYISLLVGINYLLLIWFLIKYNDIIKGEIYKFSNIKEDIKLVFKIGIPLTLAYYSSSMVQVVDKIIVENFFSIEIFSIYSFAYSMLAIINTVVSAIGTVLYPTLKKVENLNISINYINLNKIIISIILIGLAGYFPLLWIIPKFLPDYIDSLTIFRIVLPGVIFTSSITVVKHNFFKLTNSNNHYFLMSSIMIVINFALCFASFYFFKTVEAIAIASIIGLLVWYMIMEIYMIKKYKLSWIKNCFLVLFGISAFYFASEIDYYIIGGLVYIVVIFGYLVILFRKEILIMIRKFKEKKEVD